MLLAKKYLLSFAILVSLAILQFNIVTQIKPALADSTLLSNQTLLTTSANASYGSSPKDVKVIILNFLKTALALIALLMVILLIIAGFKYMTSQGNEAKIKESMGQIQSLVIGLIIILASWGLTYYILQTVVCNTTTSGGACNFFW
ncbi:MAG: hypothetical protein WCK59_00495 [Candidatus Falkowbacteria bacterium]